MTNDVRQIGAQLAAISAQLLNGSGQPAEKKRRAPKPNRRQRVAYYRSLLRNRN